MNDKRFRSELYRDALKAAPVLLGVIGAYKLLDVSPFAAIAVGGGVGYGIASMISRFGSFDDREWDRKVRLPVVEPKWIALWIVTFCAFRFLVDLSWAESICSVIALLAFFVGAEHLHRARERRRVRRD